MKTIFASTLFLLLPTLVQAASISVCQAEHWLDCQIDNLVVDGTTCDVTFGNTIDTTFLGNFGGAIDAVNAIDGVINGDGEIGIGDRILLDDVGPGPLWFEVIDSPAVSELSSNLTRGTANTWGDAGAGRINPTEELGGPYLIAEFTAAPEPATLATMLGGVELMVLAIRNRLTQLVRQTMPVR